MSVWVATSVVLASVVGISTESPLPRRNSFQPLVGDVEW